MKIAILLIIVLLAISGGVIFAVIRCRAPFRVTAVFVGFLVYGLLGALVADSLNSAMSYYHRMAFTDLLASIDDNLQKGEVERVKLALRELKGDGWYKPLRMEELSRVGDNLESDSE